MIFSLRFIGVCAREKNALLRINTLRNWVILPLNDHYLIANLHQFNRNGSDARENSQNRKSLKNVKIMKSSFVTLFFCLLSFQLFAQEGSITNPKKKRSVSADSKLSGINNASTPAGTDTAERPSVEVFTGGNLDFFNELKFQNIGGEFVLNANNIAGEKNHRLGFFFGVSNFRTFSLDSSNRNVRVQNIRTDTGKYISGQTSYLKRTLVDHRKTTNTQWSYYLNPTYRLNAVKEDMFNIYLSLRLEALRVSTTTSYLTDTVGTETTNTPLGNSAIFQSGKGFLLQNVTNVRTEGYFSIGTPMFLRSETLRVYLDPNLGIATHKIIRYTSNAAVNGLIESVTNQLKCFYLFRVRIVQQVSTDLNIVLGGEVRGLLPSNDPTINAYLGISIPLSGLRH
jgi:hypothetical protein